MQRANSLEKTLIWERLKAGEKGTTEDEMVDDITDSMNMSFTKLYETVEERGAWCGAVDGVVKSQT